MLPDIITRQCKAAFRRSWNRGVGFAVMLCTPCRPTILCQGGLLCEHSSAFVKIGPKRTCYTCTSKVHVGLPTFDIYNALHPIPECNLLHTKCLIDACFYVIK